MAKSSVLFTVLLLAISCQYASALVKWCCGGTVAPGATGDLVQFARCSSGNNDSCVTITSTSFFTNTTTVTYSCAATVSCSGTGASCCQTDNCNCPTKAPFVHKTQGQVQDVISEMRSIMFPLLGIIFAVIWLVMALMFGSLPHGTLLMVTSFAVFVFAVFIILLAKSAFFGLYFAGLAAASIAVARAGGSKGGAAIALFSALGFFMLTGTVYVVKTTPLFDDVNGYVGSCEGDMGIDNMKQYWKPYYNLDTRCEDWLLFVEFCIYMLVLLMPMQVLLAFGLYSGGSGGGKPKSANGDL